MAKSHGHRITRIIREEGVSGAKEAADRPGLSEALLVVQEKAVDGLLIPRLDRLARSITAQEATLMYVWRHGRKVFAADSGDLADDPDDPYRTAMREVAGVFAGLERRMIVKQMRDGRAAKQAAGKKSVETYAYGTQGQGEGRARDAAPNPAEAATADRILQLRTEGKSYRAIGEQLDAEGLRPRRAAQWSAMTVRSVCQKHGAA